MIINHDHRFVYIGLPKTASTTMHRWLTQPALSPAPWTPEGQDQHAFAIPPGASGYFVFATVRNPYDRAVSLWRHSQMSGRKRGCPELPTFSAFLNWLSAEGPAPPGREVFYTMRLSDRIPPTATALPIERLSSVCLLSPFRTLDDQLAPLPRLNRTRHRPWGEYYNDDAESMIWRLFQPDFERFGYTRYTGMVLSGGADKEMRVAERAPEKEHLTPC